jgi:hypothetical protein
MEVAKAGVMASATAAGIPGPPKIQQEILDQPKIQLVHQKYNNNFGSTKITMGPKKYKRPRYK